MRTEPVEPRYSVYWRVGVGALIRQRLDGQGWLSKEAPSTSKEVESALFLPGYCGSQTSLVTFIFKLILYEGRRYVWWPCPI